LVSRWPGHAVLEAYHRHDTYSGGADWHDEQSQATGMFMCLGSLLGEKREASIMGTCGGLHSRGLCVSRDWRCECRLGFEAPQLKGIPFHKIVSVTCFLGPPFAKTFTYYSRVLGFQDLPWL
jgi:hypothetical protein